MRTTTSIIHTIIYSGLPLVAIFVTKPVCSMVGASSVVMRGASVLCCIPVPGDLGSYAGKRVVGAHFVTRTGWAPSASCAVLDYCFPCMWEPIRTLAASPVHFTIALRLDDNAAKVSVLFVVPLALQLKIQLTDFWPTLLLLSWQCTALCAAAVASCC